MTYTLVTVVTDGDTSWRLENSEGEIIAEYDEKPSHPGDTANAIADEIGLNSTIKKAFVYILKKEWDFQTEEK